MKTKNIVLGVTGGIAVYKSCDIVSRLRKLNYDIDIDVIMTKNATEFVNPLTFQSLTKRMVHLDLFNNNEKPKITHIALGTESDIILVAPATANILGKVANGIGDDMLSTTLLVANPNKVFFAPAMNTNMYENIIVQENIDKLKKRGYRFIEPISGLLACDVVGKGKMEDPEVIVDIINYELTKTDEFKGKNVLITAGATIENIDPMRYLTNRSTGTMGYEIAKKFVQKGAKVTLISGASKLKVPYGVSKFIKVESAKDMFNSVMDNLYKMDIIVKSAAVADYKPKFYSNLKIKKSNDNLMLELERNPDIAMEVGKLKRKNQILVGFAAETDNIIENAKDKIIKKNLDFIVINNINQEGAGFGEETNIIQILDKNDEIESFPLMSKDKVAELIIDKVKEYL